MLKIEDSLKKILYILLTAFIVSAFLYGMRTSTLKQAYDNTASYTINDSAGVVHTVAASGLSGDTVALLYGLALGFVWVIAIIAIVFVVIKQMHMK